MSHPFTPLGFPPRRPSGPSDRFRADEAAGAASFQPSTWAPAFLPRRRSSALPWAVRVSRVDLAPLPAPQRGLSPHPVRHLGRGNACLRRRRHLRQLGVAPRAGNRQRARPAAPHLRDAFRHVGNQQVAVAGSEFGDRGRPATVGHVVLRAPPPTARRNISSARWGREPLPEEPPSVHPACDRAAKSCSVCAGRTEPYAPERKTPEGSSRAERSAGTPARGRDILNDKILWFAR